MLISQLAVVRRNANAVVRVVAVLYLIYQIANCCRVSLLPHIRMFLEFWAADDEFPASCKLFVNNNANTFLDMEFLGHLLEKAVALAIGERGLGWVVRTHEG